MRRQCAAVAVVRTRTLALRPFSISRYGRAGMGMRRTLWLGAAPHRPVVDGGAVRRSTRICCAYRGNPCKQMSHAYSLSGVRKNAAWLG